MDKTHAIGLTSSVCDDVNRKNDSGRLIVEPDGNFSNVFQSVIEAKYEKNSMHKTAAQLGPGILLVGVFTPFTTAEEVAIAEANSIIDLITSKPTKLFKKIYAYDGYGKRKFHLIYLHKA